MCNVNLVDGLVWNEEAVGSNPATQTKNNSRLVKWYNGRLISDYYKFNSCTGYQNTGKLAEGLRQRFAKPSLLTRCIGSNPILSANNTGPS